MGWMDLVERYAMMIVMTIFIVKILVGIACFVGAYFFMTAGGFWPGLTGVLLVVIGIVALLGKVSMKS